MSSDKSEIDQNNFNNGDTKFQDEKHIVDEKLMIVGQQSATTSNSETQKPNQIMSSLQQKQNEDCDGKKVTGKGHNRPSRRVLFPQQHLVTGYLEASNPFAEIRTWTSKELVVIYEESCKQHEAAPIQSVLDYLASLELVEALCRSAVLNLRDQPLTHNDCEALEAILKRVQFRIIDLNNCGLDDMSASSLFDMIEYYEATHELDVSYNPKITIRGWQSMVSMIKKSQALKTLAVRGFPVSISMAANLGQALSVSFINTLKLEHCGLAGRPIANLCTSLRNNSVLKELWLAHNDLTVYDSYQIGLMLQQNHYLQLLDISNNNIMDEGAGYITSALVQQSLDFQQMPKSTSCSSLLNISDLSASLNNINNSTARYSPVPKKHMEDIVPLKKVNNFVTATPSTPATIDLTATITTDPPKPNNQQPPPPTTTTTTDIVEANNSLVNDDDDVLKAKDFEHNDSITKNTINASFLLHQEPLQADNENNLIEKTKATTTITTTEEEKNRGGALDEQVMDSESAISVTTLNSCTNNSSVLLNINNENNIICCDSDKCTNSKKAKLNEDIIGSVQDAATITATAAKVADQDHHKDCVNNVKSNLINNNNSFSTVSENDNKFCDNVNLLLIKEENETNVPGTVVVTVESIERMEVMEKGVEAMEVVVKHEAVLKICEEPIKHQSEPIKINNNNEQPAPSVLDSKKLLSQSLDDDFNRGFLEQHQYPERSFSSESLNSETSIDSNDSKSSIKLAANKFSKYGTLERQTTTQLVSNPAETTEDQPQKSGLQVLVLWNNGITRNAARSFSDLFAQTTTLEIINVGRNNLSNEFLANVKDSLKTNHCLTNLGLQSAHLTCEGAKILSETLGFGGNSTLQRIDLRDNNIKTTGLSSINDAMSSNKTVTRIDLDDEPRCRFTDDALELNNEYTRLLNSIRAHCSRNENPPARPEPISSSGVAPTAATASTEELASTTQMRAPFCSRKSASRKISLTYHNNVRHALSSNGNQHPLLLHSDRNSINTIRASSPEVFSKQQLLDPLLKKSSSTTLRSPLPSPIPSPMSSPVASPSRNRFRVVKVKEPTSPGAASLPSRSPTSTGSSPTFFPNSRFRVVAVSEPNLSKIPAPSVHLPTLPVVKPVTSPPATLTRTKYTQSLTSLFTESVDGKNDLNKIADTTQNTLVDSKLITPNIVSRSSIEPPPPITILKPPTPTLLVVDADPLILAPALVKSSSTSSSNSDDSSLNDQPNYIESILRIQQLPVEVKIPEQPKPLPIGASINLTDTLPILSTSFDSPETDLEVKKYMDLDSCSSISSSIESINNHSHHHHHHHHQHRTNPLIGGNLNSNLFCNTSTSSIDSYDFITTDKLQRHQQQEQQKHQKPNLEASTNIYHKMNDSFDTASMSDESLSGMMNTSVLSSSPSHLSSNEGTLTNSPCLEVVNPIGTSLDELKATAPKPPKVEKRERKTSWIANANPNYPATLDKLINLFQHPGSLFTRSSPDTTKKEEPAATLSVQQQQPSRKDSPMGGLFSWVNTAHGTRKETTQIDGENIPKVQQPPSLSSSILQASISPENSVQEPAPVDTTPAENLPKNVQREFKENISPENTITAAALASISLSRPLGSAENLEPVKSKVIFELGSDDDSSSTTDANDISEIDEKPIMRGDLLPFEKSASDVSVTSTGGLGQIARDSMNVLTAHMKAAKLQETSACGSFETLHEDREATTPTTTADKNPQ